MKSKKVLYHRLATHWAFIHPKVLENNKHEHLKQRGAFDEQLLWVNQAVNTLVGISQGRLT
jgi:hypothetical protein